MDGGDAVDQEKREHILDYLGVAPDHRHFPDAAELMNADSRGQERVVSQTDVTCQGGIIGQDHMISQDTFVGYM